MSEEAVYDALVLVLPEAYRALQEAGHPKTANFDNLKRDLPFLVATANERLKGMGISVDDSQLQEFFRYSITALIRSYRDGDWRPYVFMNELFYEVLPVKRALEWVLNTAPLPPSPNIGEINNVTPLVLARVASRVGGRQVLMLERANLENTLFREITDEYVRRYSMNLTLVSLENAQEVDKLRESLDMFFAGSLGGWKLGWRSIVSLAMLLLKRRGILALLLPLNSREGLKTLLGLFDVPEYPSLDQVAGDLQKSRFTNIRVNRERGFAAVVAVKR
ncbi:hypothetical protein IG193_07175 [Infirmifilum lucidum]|uniref:Uncharacterized protein n=1 Tax=Infirmifilum lucidum TaxID=2776706 RepID=A0A7L9FFH2_9CREN|nr:hypothetical protein [Infirmifilum lucidum]QOJ78530.1 hypothetical protein IG193_07175 [Infirmifilum lucidum]